MWIWVWLAVTAMGLITEFITMEIVSIWFVFGGVIAMILAGLSVAVEIQIMVFIAVSLVLLLSFRRLALKHLLKKPQEKTNAESIIGRTYKLLSDITTIDNGTIKINGVVWTAVTEDDSELKAGTFVEVLRISGNKYIVKKTDKNQPNLHL